MPLGPDRASCDLSLASVFMGAQISHMTNLSQVTSSQVNNRVSLSEAGHKAQRYHVKCLSLWRSHSECA